MCRVSAALDGEALSVYESLSAESRLTMLRLLRFENTLQTYGVSTDRNLRHLNINVNESQRKFASRLRNILRSWLE